MYKDILQVKHIVSECITLSIIGVESKWNGVLFDDFMPDTYTRERVTKFRSLAKNRGKVMKLFFELGFEQYDGNYDGYIDDICTIKACVSVTFDDMEQGRYKIDVSSKSGERLKGYIGECVGVDADAFSDMVRGAWKEHETDYFVEWEFKEKIGEQDFLYDLIDKVKEKIVAVTVKWAGLR